MFGIDISNWQKGINLKNENFDFAIVKATEGRTYTDPAFYDFAKQLTKLGKLIGCYHYARPDNQNTCSSMLLEADNFCNAVEKAGLIGKAILVLDWEEQPTNRHDLAEEFLSRVEKITGVKPLIYASASVISKSYFSAVRAKYPVWLAQWTTSTKMSVSESNDWLKFHMLNKITVYWKIWQFTDKGRWTGWNDNIDFDYTYITPEEWKRYARSHKFNSDIIAQPESISSDMEWAISNGIIKGYSNGKYGPKDFLTREQMASMLKRFYDIIK